MPTVIVKKKRAKTATAKQQPQNSQKHSQKQPQEKPLWPAVLAELDGQRVVIQAKSGVLFSGTLALEKGGCNFLCLRDACITGRNRTAVVEKVWIDRGVVHHIHPEPKEVKEAPNGDN